jgi:sigma-B regulation protein RsbU (phosphoserine phosphatase)
VTSYRIRCAEVWGGIDHIDTDIVTGGLTASVYSKASGGPRGGDVYYFSVCGGDQLTRIALADVQGHGESIAQVSAWLYDLVRDSLESLDSTEILKSLNMLMLEQHEQVTATVAIVSYYLGDHTLYFSYAGHPPVLLQKRTGAAWTPLDLDDEKGLVNLPLGMFPGVTYSQQTTSVDPGDRVFVYSDGITEYPSSQGVPIGPEWLIEHLQARSDRSTAELKQTVLAALTGENASGADHDDMTLMVVEVN